MKGPSRGSIPPAVVTPHKDFDSGNLMKPASLENYQKLMKNYSKGELERAMRRMVKEQMEECKTQDILHNNNQKATLTYLDTLSDPAGEVTEYANRVHWFRQRFHLIQRATVYKFKDEFVKLLAESNKNDIGYRHMPFDNIFLEVFLELGDLFVTGIHIAKVKWTEEGHEAMQVKGYPEINGDDGIAIFFTGGDKDGGKFFNHLSLSKNNIYDEMREQSKFSCPHCGTPLKQMTNNYWVCESKVCETDKGVLTFDVSNPKALKSIKDKSMKDIWKHDEEIRMFVTNFLDFITNPEVEVRPTLDKKSLEERNAKRAKRGKKPFIPINIVRVTGHLFKYVSGLKERYGERQYIAYEHIVKGHWMRFWNAEHYTQLYGFLKGARSDEVREARLKKILRRDPEKGHVLPASQQYIWDKDYQVIKVWKLPFVRNEGVGFSDKERVNVVEVT